MDEVKKFYDEGFVTEGSYRRAALKATLKLLDELEYKTVKFLGHGSFGSVLEIKSPYSESNLAIKTVLEHRVSKNELEVWPALKHPNLLRLNASNYFSNSYTYIFITDVCPVTLNQNFNNLNFLLDNRALERSVSWLRGILSGLEYLHGKNLCHLDLKTDNILVTKEDRAVITDFGFLASTESFTSGYGSPLIYRPPECSTAEYCAEVDGCKYDMWSVGLLALEMFTRESLLKAASNWKMLSVDYWPEEIYPTIFNILQQEEFGKLMDTAFPASNVLEGHVVNVINLIKSLLDLNPAMRPSSKEALQHRLFGGDRFDAADQFVWTQRASVLDVKALQKMFRILELNRRPRTVSCDINQSTQDTKRSSESHESLIDVSGMSTEKSKAKTSIGYEKFTNDAESGESSDTAEKSGNGKDKFVAWMRKKRSFLSTVFNKFRPMRK